MVVPVNAALSASTPNSTKCRSSSMRELWRCFRHLCDRPLSNAFQLTPGSTGSMAAASHPPPLTRRSDSGYTSHGYADDRFSSFGAGGGGGPSIKLFSIERAAQDWLIQAVFEKLFVRFPNLRVASVENGSDFLAPMFRKFEHTARKNYWWFDDHPIDVFKQHVWMNPFWEDDADEVVELMGADRVIFGSDWPHIEGMPEPLDYLVELKNLDDGQLRQVMLDNVTELNTLRPC